MADGFKHCGFSSSFFLWLQRLVVIEWPRGLLTKEVSSLFFLKVFQRYCHVSMILWIILLLQGHSFSLKLEFGIKLMAIGQISQLWSLFREKMFGSPGGRSSYWIKPSTTSYQEVALIRDSWPGDDSSLPQSFALFQNFVFVPPWHKEENLLNFLMPIRFWQTLSNVFHLIHSKSRKPRTVMGPFCISG